jgi:SAM-dependent methyltransferase
VEGYDAATYGERFADVYDDWYASVTDADACVARLAALAADAAGPVLELGIGTGRLALPMAAMGFDVRGVDASPAMLDRLRAKPGAEALAVGEADLARLVAPTRADDPPAGPRFALVFVAYNTLFNLTEAADQQACVTRVAALLADGGRFVVEAFVPPSPEEPPGPSDGVAVRELTVDRVVLSVARHDAGDQTMTGQFVDISEAGIRLRPWHLRYRTPAQLDDLATGAGLVLEHRWAGWRREPFDDSSTTHVSVYRLA